MIRKIITPILLCLGFAATATACHAGARLGPVHGGGGVSSR